VLLLFGLVTLALGVYAVLDVVTTPRAAVRTLPKPAWLLVVLPPLVGPALWFFAGRPSKEARAEAARLAPPAPPVAPDDDPEFLREMRRRADEQRRRARDPRDD
jgi:hypothetical protein